MKFVFVCVDVMILIDFLVMCVVFKVCCNCVLEYFDVWFEVFECEVMWCGMMVLFVEMIVDVVWFVVDIVCWYDVKKVIKIKLMVFEEMCLNVVFVEMGV